MQRTMFNRDAVRSGAKKRCSAERGKKRGSAERGKKKGGKWGGEKKGGSGEERKKEAVREKWQLGELMLWLSQLDDLAIVLPR